MEVQIDQSLNVLSLTKRLHQATMKLGSYKTLRQIKSQLATLKDDVPDPLYERSSDKISPME